jgi:hypothetical protein
LPWIRLGLNTRCTERPRHAVGAVLRPREHERILDFAAFQQGEEQPIFQMLRHRIIACVMPTAGAHADSC